MTKSQNPYTCACGDTFKSWYLLDKHIKTSPVEICKQRKKRGFAAKPNAHAIHKAQKLRRYHEKQKEKYNSAEEVEKRKLREENKEQRQTEKLHKKQQAEQEKAEQQAREELEELTRLQDRYKIKVEWKEEEVDIRDLAKDFGRENDEWEEAFDNGYDPLESHNALRYFRGLFDWCEDDYWKEKYIASSWNSACYVSETRRGLENIGHIYKYDYKNYKPITDKWKELLPGNMCKSKKESTDEDKVSEDSTWLV